MKLKQVIWKEISNSTLFISNDGRVKSSMGGDILNFDLRSDLLKCFNEDDFEMIEDDDISLEDRICIRITEEDFFKNITQL